MTCTKKRNSAQGVCVASLQMLLHIRCNAERERVKEKVIIFDSAEKEFILGAEIRCMWRVWCVVWLCVCVCAYVCEVATSAAPIWWGCTSLTSLAKAAQYTGLSKDVAWRSQSRR